MFIAGVEEAGRGPVIGPMVMAILWTEDEELLRTVGAKDSKQLRAAERDTIFEKLTALKEHGKIGFEIAVLQPYEIDAAVLGEHDNLNKLEQRTTARLIMAALKAEPIKKVLIDCPTRSTQKYADQLRMMLKESDSLKLVVENKADENYVVVGAASVVAKVTRDREIERIKLKYGVDLGSGYPSDPVTQRFLKENWQKQEFSSFFRKSWASYANVAGRRKQSSLSDFGTPQRSLAGFAPEEPVDEELQRFEFPKEHGFAAVPVTSEHDLLRRMSPDATSSSTRLAPFWSRGRGRRRRKRSFRQQD